MPSVVAFLLTHCVEHRGSDVDVGGAERGVGMGRGGERVGVAISGASARLPMSTDTGAFIGIHRYSSIYWNPPILAS